MPKNPYLRPVGRYFNTTGFCNPEEHYMVNPFRGVLDDIYQLIERKQYFLIHAPRQTGKTTLLHELTKRINAEGRYTSMIVSMENAGMQSLALDAANKIFVNSIYLSAGSFLPKEEWPPNPSGMTPEPDMLQQYLTAWAVEQPKPIVLFIDEADSLWDDVLVSFLRQMRNGFQHRPKRFPQSVALVGLRDIREYKMKARASNPSLGSGSPFNVKAKSFLLPVFSPEEVRGLLQQHADDTGQDFSSEVQEKLYAYTGGQPWLVNAIANEIVAEMLGNDHSRPITPNLVDEAKERLIEQRQTHLDSLTDKIREPRVMRVVNSIIEGGILNFNTADDDLLYCRDLGIITYSDPIRFANPMYEEIITRLLNTGIQRSLPEDIAATAWYVQPDGRLDMDKLLSAFTDFYRWNSESWLERFEYAEAGHQLLLMAFLQRVVNGGGRIEREMAIGNGRTDLAVFWQDQVIPIEIKLHHDARALPQGLQQLGRYMDKLGQQHGYLIIFEKQSSEELPWEVRIRREEQEVEGRRISVLWM
jgi:hypothetical protein